MPSEPRSDVLPPSALRPSRRWRFALVGGALVATAVACSSATQPAPGADGVFCANGPVACACDAVSSPPSGQVPACNQAAYPGTTCCADPAWPASGSCGCSTNEIACGIVPGYFGPLFDGGPTAGCVCSPGTYARGGQVLGGACEPGGWANPPSSVGVCCFYPADFPNQLDGATCACGPAFNCAPGSTKVASCSAASFPAPMPVSCAGAVVVTSCTAGRSSDAGQGSDASQVAD
jgi:hypothetical protein